MSNDMLMDAGMLELFRAEAETHSGALEHGLVDLEAHPGDLARIEPLMRAAHSIKGAARIIGLTGAVGLAHAMEDVLVAAQKEKLAINREIIDLLLKGTDVYQRLAKVPTTEMSGWLVQESGVMQGLQGALGAALTGQPPPAPALPVPVAVPEPAPTALPGPAQASGQPPAELPAAPPPAVQAADIASPESAVPVSTETLNRLLGLAGECLVEARRLPTFLQDLSRVRINQGQSAARFERLLELIGEGGAGDESLALSARIQELEAESRQQLIESMGRLENYAHRLEDLTGRLYNEAVASRMRPLSDGVKGFPRLVRDAAQQLGKTIHLRIEGQATRVDRDILARLEAPLNHLLRNACDHGIESPEARLAASKLADGVIRLEAAHKSGMLMITVSDDGRGIDPEKIRRQIVARNLASEEMAASLGSSELFDFLFLPGFSTAASVTDLSGRGVGLDVVQTMVQEVGGTIQVSSRPGEGTSFQLQLPLTLSVIRALIVEIAGEPYAFSLSKVDRVLKVPVGELQLVENRQYYPFDGANIGLVSARQPLGLGETLPPEGDLPVLVVSARLGRYGVVADRLLGERELVVRPLDARLGKIPDISAAAILEDGTPALIVDVDDLVRSVDRLLAGGRLSKIEGEKRVAPVKTKRILVVDDSITVREVERRLLENRGYEVDLAVDGMDGWNRVRSGRYDLVISDIDMPRLNGIEMVRRIKQTPDLEHLPVMIVSYKDRDEDRLLGLEAGANYYLTKSSFHDESLLDSVVDLIGEP